MGRMLDGFKQRFFSRHNHRIDMLAQANALVSGFALYPQLFRLIATRETEDLSPTTFLMFFVSNAIWLVYGIHRSALPTIVSAILSVIAAGGVLALILVWS